MRRHALLLLSLATLGGSGCAAAARLKPPAPVVSLGACTDTVSLVVATTTDVHGRLRGWDYELDRPDSARGLTRAATVIDSLRTAHPGRLLLLDAGDLLQGNMLAYVGARVLADTMNPIVTAMNAMAYDAAAIGNHEFNFGVPHLDRAVRQAAFPFLSANTYRPDGSHAYQPYAIVERGGVRIGIIGATTPGVMVWDRDNVRGRVTLGDIVPAVRAAAGDARRAGADVLVVTVHSGLDEAASYDTAATGLPSENVTARIAREVPGIALIVYGHSHKQNAGSSIGSTRLVQAKNWSQSVGVAMLVVARCAGTAALVAERTTSVLIPVAGRSESAPLVAVTAPWHARTVEYVTAPIGRTAVAWRGDSSRVRDTPIVDFVLEVMRAAAGAELAAGSAFTLAGLDSGAISIADLARIYPYDNTLRAVRISGAQLRLYLEHAARHYGTFGDSAQPTVDPRIPGYNFDIIAGAEYTLDLSRPIGSRLVTLRARGRDVQATDTFTMALNNYRQTGGGGFAAVAGAPVVYEGAEEIRVLLEREVRRRGTIRPEDYFRQNWRLEPAAAVGRAYRATHDGRSGIQRGNGTTPAGPYVRLIATNDFHGALEPRADAQGRRRGGAAHLATAITRAAAECRAPNCLPLLLDGGDQWQGTAASNFAFGRPVVRMFDHLGLAAAALGNHEFDWGVDTLRARMRDARYRILAANVRDRSGRDVPWIRNDTMVTRGTLKVGIIGVATTATPRTTRSSNVRDLRFVEPAPIVDSITRALRRRGADLVVVIAHAGAFCDGQGDRQCRGEIVDLAGALKEPVDAIVSGHTHSRVDAVVNGMPIVQARSRGEAIGIADLRPAQRGSADDSTATVREVLSDSLPPEPATDSIVRQAVAAIGPRMSRPVATFAQRVTRSGAQSALGNLVADAQRWSGRSDVAVMNNGGLRADLRAGVATFGDLYEVQPFGNILYRYRITGRALRDYAERLVGREPVNSHVSGMVVRYDQSRPAGRRVVSVTMADGSELRDGRYYTLVMSDFLATGGDGLALTRKAGRFDDLKTVDVDALAAYLRSRPQPVALPQERRLLDVSAQSQR